MERAKGKGGPRRHNVRGNRGYLLLLRFEQRKQLRIVHLATPDDSGQHLSRAVNNRAKKMTRLRGCVYPYVGLAKVS